MRDVSCVFQLPWPVSLQRTFYSWTCLFSRSSYWPLLSACDLWQGLCTLLFRFSKQDLRSQSLNLCLCLKTTPGYKRKELLDLLDQSGQRRQRQQCGKAGNLTICAPWLWSVYLPSLLLGQYVDLLSHWGYLYDRIYNTPFLLELFPLEFSAEKCCYVSSAFKWVVCFSNQLQVGDFFIELQSAILIFKAFSHTMA